MKNFRIESIVIAVGFLLLGLCIKGRTLLVRFKSDF